MLSIAALVFAAVSAAPFGGHLQIGPGNGMAIPVVSMGMNDLHAGEAAPLTTPWPAVRFGSIRLWDDDTSWNAIETSRGTYDWSMLDNWVNLAESHHVSIEYTFGRTPSWAGPDQTMPPDDIQDWDDFVTALVTRYKGRIEAYEIWNEVNNPNYWTGTLEQLVLMQQHAHDTIKSIDINAVVLSASFVGGAMHGLTEFLAYGGAGCVDGVAVHLYPDVTDAAAPEDYLPKWIEGYRSAMREYGLAGKRLWNTEFGWGLNTNLPDADLQAGYVARAYILCWSQSVQRNYWYAYDNAGWGTLRVAHSGDPGVLTEAGRAYTAVYDWLVGAYITSPCEPGWNGTTWTCGFGRTFPFGYKALAVWDSLGSAEFTVPPGYGQYRDLDGERWPVSPGSTIRIGVRPILFESFSPVQGPNRAAYRPTLPGSTGTAAVASNWLPLHSPDK